MRVRLLDKVNFSSYLLGMNRVAISNGSAARALISRVFSASNPVGLSAPL